MELGRAMEDACMDYFEEKMGIRIDERNSEIGYAVDGKLKCKRDGRTFIEGIETGWENKYSNASVSFTGNMNYILQCQAYMMAWGLEQWVLAGMWKGKPVYRLIKADTDIQQDIEAMVLHLYDILIGVADIDTFPWDIVERYSVAKECRTLSEEELTESDKELFRTLGELKASKKAIEAQLEEIESYLKETFSDSKFEDENFKYTISTSAGRTSVDIDAICMDYPLIDMSKYTKTGTPFKTIRVSNKRK